MRDCHMCLQPCPVKNYATIKSDIVKPYLPQIKRLCSKIPGDNSALVCRPCVTKLKRFLIALKELIDLKGMVNLNNYIDFSSLLYTPKEIQKTDKSIPGSDSFRPIKPKPQTTIVHRYAPNPPYVTEMKGSSKGQKLPVSGNPIVLSHKGGHGQLRFILARPTIGICGETVRLLKDNQDSSQKTAIPGKVGIYHCIYITGPLITSHLAEQNFICIIVINRNVLQLLEMI